MTNNANINPIQQGKTESDTNTPELSKYSLELHFPELQVAGTTIPAGVSKDTVWAANRFDAIRWAAKKWKMAKRVEVIG